MKTHAYYELYVDLAQRILGDMMDFAVNTCGMEPDEYFTYFLESSISKQFAEGNPMYVAGCTGCELFRKVLAECGLPMPHRRMPCIWTSRPNIGAVEVLEARYQKWNQEGNC